MSTNNNFDLSGKTALVTGCKRGIGSAMAVALAQAGADIIGVSASLQKSGSEIEQKVTALGRKFTAFKCDFADKHAVTNFANDALDCVPKIDILVNNAGTIKRAPAAKHSDEFWDQVLEVNLSSQFRLTRQIGGAMLQNGSGKIIFIASLLTFQGGVNVPGYAASKGGIGQLTKAFSNEWAGSGINVNAIAPGYVATDNTQALQDDPARSRAILERIPAGRWGTAEDFKGPVVFLASSAADYVHGTILTVDGGWMAR